MPTDNNEHDAIELSIILISYNTKQITQNTLESIYRSMSSTNQSQYEVIVIDNASSDGSIEMLEGMKSQHSNLHLIKSTENLGFSKGNNHAFKASKGRYILFLNSDIIVLDHAIESLLDFYKKNEDHIHFAGGKLLNEDNTPQPSGGPFYTPFIVFASLFLRGDYWGLTRSSPDETRQLDWISGACIMTKRKIFNELEGFDEQIFMYMDEIDLLYRAAQKGYNTYIFPPAQFIHLGSASSQGKTYPILQVYNGFLYFYKKHFGPGSITILRLMLQLKAVVAMTIGKLTHNQYLIHTYEQAYKIASVD